jgi:formate hydrogenlyase subunit 6/NADH:ubiquinone oxidoreductase subunit I
MQGRPDKGMNPPDPRSGERALTVSPVKAVVIPDVQRFIRGVRDAATSVFEGLAVTLSYLFRKPVTLQYPDRLPRPVPEMLPESFRGFIEADVSICTGCLACMKRCPIGVIRIEVERNPETKTGAITRFDVDAGLCMYCGLCTEVCPTGAIRHCTEFEGSATHPAGLMLHYVRPGETAPVYRISKDSPPQGLKRNEPFRRARTSWDEPAPVAPDAARGAVRWKGKRSEEAAS